MNAAMNGTGQHEIHPDAEMLSAFAEQALNAKERSEVLKHLAVCSRCRQVVALAREAAGTEVVGARHGVVRPRAWWRSWGLALAPLAAAAAMAVIAIYVHERGVERSAEVAKLEQQRVNEKAPPLPQASPQPPVQAAPPAPAALVKPGAKESRSERASVRPRDREQAAKAPKEAQLEFIDPFVSQGGPIPTVAEEQELNRALVGPAGSGGAARIPEFDEERKKQAEEQAEDRHLFAARAPASSDEHGRGSDTAGSSAGRSTEPAHISAQQLQTQPAREAGYLQLHGLRSMVNVSTGPYAFHLPSGQPAVSIASADHRTLAIDEAGILFLSKDPGGTWEKVKRQWTGRAVVVRRHANGIDTTEATPPPGTAGDTPDSGAVSQPDTVFELVNDQSQVWISVDGRIWTPK